MDEVEALIIYEVSWSLQTMCNRSGYSPAQRVLGKQPRVTLDMISDVQNYELSTTNDAAWRRFELRLGKPLPTRSNKSEK